MVDGSGLLILKRHRLERISRIVDWLYKEELMAPNYEMYENEEQDEGFHISSGLRLPWAHLSAHTGKEGLMCTRAHER